MTYVLVVMAGENKMMRAASVRDGGMPLMTNSARAAGIAFALLGLLSLSPLSLAAPIVVESRSTELKDRFRESLDSGQATDEMSADTTPIETEPMAIESEEASLSAMDMTYQMQVLQQEVMSLRGMVEQLSHDLQKSKSIQEDRYLELDRRLQSQPTVALSVALSDSVEVSADLSLVSDSDADTPIVDDEIKPEQSYYDQGRTLILARDYDQAIASLRLVIEHYPIGVYAPNAYYWIGEVHAAKPEPDYEAARQALVQVIKSYPDSNKVPDAAFKLGKVYHLMGDCQRAKASLSDVAKTYSTKSAGKLAERYVLDQIAC